MAFNFIPKIEFTPPGGSLTTIQFEFPPKGFDPEGITVDGKGRVTESANGVFQTSLNYIEERREVVFSMLTDTLRGELDTFMKTHALKGFSFDYFPHGEEISTKITVELTKRGRNYSPRKEVPSSRFEFKLSMRRAL